MQDALLSAFWNEFAELQRATSCAGFDAEMNPRYMGRAIPKHPQPSAAHMRKEAVLIEAMLTGAVEFRTPEMLNMLKPKPMRYEADTSHLHNCTICKNQRAARRAARAAALHASSGAPQLLVDDAPLAAWENVVHELELPRKTRTTFQERDSATNAPDSWPEGFGMPGSVVYENGRYRAWLGQSVQRYYESEDGIRFFREGVLPNASMLQWLGQPRVLHDPQGQGDLRKASEAELKRWWGELGTSALKPRDLAQETLTVYRDADAPAKERYKAAFTCDVVGHNPYPQFWQYKLGTYGTPLGNPNWWREVRGVRISSNQQLRATSNGRPRAFSERVHWIFDKDSKAEHLRRQLYSLQVTPDPAARVYYGLLNVLEWPKMINSPKPPFRYDVMRTYLATSRDGIHFDTDWVYAQQELIPHGRCRRPPFCLDLSLLNERSRGPSRTPYDELCCEFDHGIVIPASQLLTTRSEHLLYYEGRMGYHERRYAPTYPMRIGAAVWREHRLAGIRSDPGTTGRQCGAVLTKWLDLHSVANAGRASTAEEATIQPAARRARGIVHFTVNVGFSKPRARPDAAHRTHDTHSSTGGHASAAINTSASDGAQAASRSALLYELVEDCTEKATADNGGSSSGADSWVRESPGGGSAGRLMTLTQSIPITNDATSAVLRWRTGEARRPRSSVRVARTRRARLRFVLCGDAKLYSFTAWRGPPPGEEGEYTLGASAEPRKGSKAPTAVTSAREAAIGSSDASASAYAAPALQPAKTAVLLAAEAHERAIRRQSTSRVQEMQKYAVLYGHCSSTRPPDMQYHEKCEQPGCSSNPGGSISLGLHPNSRSGETASFPSPSLGTNGVESCRLLCLLKCPTCRYASMSWNELTCDCFQRCSMHTLALAQLIDNSQPQLTDVKGVELISAIGLADPTFDYVSFGLDRNGNVTMRPRLRSGSKFPTRLWGSTAEWATDWVRYKRALEAENVSVVPPHWLEEAQAGTRKARKRNIPGLMSHELSQTAMQGLGLQAGFCAVTSTGSASCDEDRKGFIPLSSLTIEYQKPHDWGVAIDACLDACRQCRRCNYISMSRSQNDCSWYKACDIDHLSTQYAGFYSMHVPKAFPKSFSRKWNRTSARSHRATA